MAVTLYLYKFDKRLDSVANPNTVSTPPTSLQISGRFLLPTSIQNPIIELTDIENQDIKEYNYAYIVEFKRFYFIANMSTYEKRWSVFLKEDLLGTYRTAIRESNQYVKRSYSHYNGNIIDDFYATQAKNPLATIYRSSLSSTIFHRTSTGTSATLDRIPTYTYFHSNINNGYFVIGVLGGSVSGVDYYCMDATAFKQFLANTFIIAPSNMTDVSTGLKQALYDPLKYITLCKWYPTKPMVATVSVTSFNIGSQSISITQGNAYSLSLMSEDYYMFFNVPDHYDVYTSNPTRKYLNLSPYIEYTFHSSMFGDIPIDTTKLFGNPQVILNWTVDYATGKTRVRVIINRPNTNVDTTDDAEVLAALLNAEGHTYDVDSLLAVVETESGVNLPIASLVTDWKAGLGLGALTFLKNKVEDSGNGDVAFSMPGYEVGVSIGEAIKSGYNELSNSSIFGGMSLADGMMAADRMLSDSGGGGGHSFGGNTSVNERGHGGHGASFGLASASASALQSGNTNYTVSKALEDAIGLVSSAMGQLNHVGNSGSFVSYIERPVLFAWCYSQQEYDDERFGRPLNKNMKLSLLSGICICKNAYITDFKVGNESNECWYPMQQEVTMLNHLLNNGIYLE